MATDVKLQTWREQVITPANGAVTPVYFNDTRPNHIIINNAGDNALYVGFDGSLSNTTYNYMIAAGATKVIARPQPFYNINVRRYGDGGHILIQSYVDEFTIASVPQTIDTVTLQQMVGEVAVTDLPPLPRGDNKIGIVDVVNPLPAGNNKIGIVEIEGGNISVDGDSGLSNFKTGLMTVTATATPVKIGATILANRKQLLMLPPAEGTVYWGSDATVTADTGIPLSAGDGSVSFDIKPNSNMSIYVVSDGTDRAIKIVEGA